ncbi:hypothetical protein L6452_23010 [Arctium lappa]|uniref:Uncharacterized protein n=1 Tax=Arctium lappa TaxID=4217 RepID=A0ACB9B5N4_ARCLA|nr:hypothetical protein L6452_23010 [Arctium lappa]
MLVVFISQILKMDLDLGNYERCLDIKLTRDHNITTGKIYQGTSNLCHILKFLDNSLIVLVNTLRVL